MVPRNGEGPSSGDARSNNLLSVCESVGQTIILPAEKSAPRWAPSDRLSARFALLNDRAAYLAPCTSLGSLSGRPEFRLHSNLSRCQERAPATGFVAVSRFSGRARQTTAP